VVEARPQAVGPRHQGGQDFDYRSEDDPRYRSTFRPLSTLPAGTAVRRMPPATVVRTTANRDRSARVSRREADAMICGEAVMSHLA